MKKTKYGAAAKNPTKKEKVMAVEKTVQITRKDLPALIAELCKKGARPIGVIMRSEKPLLKKDRISGDLHNFGTQVTAITRYSAMFNFDYANSVNLEREREGKTADFTSGKSERKAWFAHKDGDPRPLVRHKVDENKLYLQLKVQKKLGQTYLLNDGTVATEKELANLLPKHSDSKNQGVSKPIITIVPSLENILTLTSDHVNYEIHE